MKIKRDADKKEKIFQMKELSKLKEYNNSIDYVKLNEHQRKIGAIIDKRKEALRDKSIENNESKEFLQLLKDVRNDNQYHVKEKSN